jgi:exodeoxyribonuclease III
LLESTCRINFPTTLVDASHWMAFSLTTRPISLQIGRRTVAMVGTRSSSVKRGNTASVVLSAVVSEKRARVAAAQPAPIARSGPVVSSAIQASTQPSYSEEDVISIVSWNVCSLRSMLKTEAFEELVASTRATFYFLQESKMTENSQEKLDDPNLVPGYSVIWNHSVSPLGHHGVAVLVSDSCPFRIASVDKGIGSSVDAEGRVLSLHLESDCFKPLTIVNLYVPNSGAKLMRLSLRTDDWEPRMRAYLTTVVKANPVVVCGDMNVAHQEIDIHNSKGNLKNAGHTHEERAAFGKLLAAGDGFVDCFRAMNPDVKDAYTFWSRRKATTREQNKGWRLDYGIVSKNLYEQVVDTLHLTSVRGSDHAPVLITLRPPRS